MYTLYNKNIYNQKAKMAELVDAKASKAFIYTKCDEFKSLSSYVKICYKPFILTNKSAAPFRSKDRKCLKTLWFVRTKVLRPFGL